MDLQEELHELHEDLSIFKEQTQKAIDHYSKRIEKLQQQLEPEITEGQYWDVFNGMHRVRDVDRDYVHLWSIEGYNLAPTTPQILSRKGVLLSDKEVEQALIKEAKRRGFIKGAKVNSLSGYGTGTIRVKDSDSCMDGIYDYWSGSDRLWAYSDNEGGSMKIYCGGEWAKIIGDEWEKTHLSCSNGYTLKNNKHNIILDMSGNCLDSNQADILAEKLNSLCDG